MQPLVTAAELDALLEAHAFTREAGLRVTSFAWGVCTLESPYQESRERPGGIVSGQVYVHAADVAMWLAIKTQLGMDDASVTWEMKTNFLSPARREPVFATARILKLGRQLIYGVAECANRDGKLVAHHTLTYARRP